MKNLAIIGASYLQLPLIRKAKEMGFITHVFAWAANDVGEKEADFFYPISIIEKDAILKKCEEIGIVGICSIASDLASITVNYVASNLNLNANDMPTTMRCTNKYLMRETFRLNGDPSPLSFIVNNENELKELCLKYPVIIKPTDRSGSRGIFKVNSPEILTESFYKALSESFEKKVLVEEFVEGTEYSVEYLSHKGVHNFLAVTLKYTTGAPHFIETAHSEPVFLEEIILDKIKKVVEHALTSLGVKEGASHSEIKIADDGTIKIIEIGARMGGDCIGSHLVKYSTGIDFLKAVIQVACNQSPDLSSSGLKQAVKVVFIFTEEDKKASETLKKTEPDKILDVIDTHFELIGKTTDSSNRAGCYIIREC